MGAAGDLQAGCCSRSPLTITTVPVIEGREWPYEDEIGAMGSFDIATAGRMSDTATTSVFGGLWSVRYRWCTCTGRYPATVSGERPCHLATRRVR